jgi:hypothetical protein
MVVEVKINGKGPYRLIFDTGAPINLVNNKVAKEAEIIPKDFKRPPLVLFGSIGQFKIKTLELGELKAENLNTMVMDHPTVGIIAKALGPIEGSSGFNVFGKYRSTIDYQAKVIRSAEQLQAGGHDDTDDDAAAAAGGAGQGQGAGLRRACSGFGLTKTDDEEHGVAVAEVFAGATRRPRRVKPGRLLTLDGRWTDSVADCYFAASRAAGLENRGRSAPRRQEDDIAA